MSLGLSKLIGIFVGTDRTISGNMWWEESFEINFTHTIEWPDIPPHSTAILIAEVDYGWFNQKWRHYDEAGEILCDPTNPSRPFDFIWSQRENAAPRMRFKIFPNDETPTPYDRPIVEMKSGSSGSGA